MSAAPRELSFPTPPPPMHSEAAEQAVVGALLIGGKEATGALRAAGLDPSDCYDGRHERIVRAAYSVDAAGSVPDPITICEELSSTGELGAAGGKDYIGDLLEAVPTWANIEYHAGIVIERAQRRAAIDAFSRHADLLRDGKNSITDVVGSIRPALDVLATVGKKGASRFQLLTDTDLDSLGELDPLIADLAFRDSLVALIGMYGTYKTFILLEIAFCIAIGADYHGRRVRQGPVVYIYAEGARGARGRLAALKQAYGYTGSAALYFLPTSVLVTDPPQVAQLIAAIKGLNVTPEAVVIDTVARNMAGDENKAEDMGRFIRGCDMIREVFGCTVFLAHHTGWQGERSRGSVSLPGAITTEILVSRADDTVTLTCTKQKDAPPFAPIALEAFPMAGSLVLRAVDPGSSKLTPNECTALNVVQASDGLTATAWKDAAGLAKGSFHNARTRLLRLAYVRQSKNLYVATDAGRLAIGSTVKHGSGEGQHPASVVGQHAHTSLEVSVDPDRSERGKGS